MVKSWLVLVLLFILSNIAIILGYYNLNLGFNMTVIRWLYSSIPVFTGSLLLTGLLPINLLIGFFTSKGNYQAYFQEVLVLSLITPFLVIFMHLPSEGNVPDLLRLNMYTLVILVLVTHLICSRLLLKQIWLCGGRS